MDESTPWYWEPFDLFRNAGADASTAFFEFTVKQKYSKGDYIVIANDVGTRIFFLEEGIVKVFNLSPNGTQTIFWFCVPGDVFGAGAISGSYFQSVYAQAVESSTVHFISRANFEKVMKEHPQIAINMIRLLGARLRLACDSMVDVSEQKAESRLARVLLRLAHNYGRRAGGKVEIRVRVSHQELADMIGSSRQTVNALLHEFSDNGWIHLKGRTFSIISQGDLQKIIDMGRTD
ncbi:Crp/Fnr family transcriptional regulator [Sulfuriferula plumbiphila]|uniref:Crp/Fnr family transcriptional regulator n=1 Tax=Sulfuriferula plumbiphila TaxID=171865 RepID=A0A512LCA2_9PROT|nr:Crp/Fnr family transcriptional regulator [Sulfuriferula plumbiphila]BBP04755.1 Crp/Fnr family transcriptional regulator [Sulfuriferula plumbiphila]GEP32119.1 Crp/Fnr family transcriptional regulator [Sulfuriferula plumbiphila]